MEKRSFVLSRRSSRNWSAKSTLRAGAAAKTALLIGNGQFDDDPGLAPLTAPSADVEELRRVLKDPSIGGSATFRCYWMPTSRRPLGRSVIYFGTDPGTTPYFSTTPGTGYRTMAGNCT